MKKHWLDKPILRDLFWFIVLPHRLKMFLAAQDTLPPEMAQVLHDNLWDLYDDGMTAEDDSPETLREIEVPLKSSHRRPPPVGANMPSTPH